VWFSVVIERWRGALSRRGQRDFAHWF